MSLELVTGIRKLTGSLERLGARLYRGRLNNKLAKMKVSTSLLKQEAGADDCPLLCITCVG